MIGLYAIRHLPPDLLGVYALTFAGFVLVTMIPTQAVFLPAEISVLDRPSAARMDYARTSLAVGVGPSAVSGLLLLAAVAVAPPEVPDGAVVGLVLSGMVCGWLSPLQDHIRRMWHLSHQSWNAAGMSVVQLTVAAAAMTALAASTLDDHLVPFTALAIANAASLGLGLLRMRGRSQPQIGVDLRLPALLVSGKWLTVAGVAPALSGFVAAVLVARLAGADSLGFAEAARVVAQPVHVLAMGLAAVLRPRSMEAGARRDRPSAVRSERAFLGILAVFSTAYVLAVGVTWAANPLPRLLPTAYAVDGLVLLTGVAVLLVSAAVAVRAELMGARLEVPIAGAEAVGGAAQLSASLAAVAVHAYAMPASFIALALTRLARLYRLRGRVYGARGKPAGQRRGRAGAGDVPGGG